MKAKAYILLTLIAVMLCMMFACKPRIITNTITETKTTTIKERDTVFNFKGASVGANVKVDSIIEVLKNQFKQGLNGVSTKQTYTDPNTKVKLSFWIDQYGKLQADCSSKDSLFAAKLQTILTEHNKELQSIEAKVEKYIPTWFKVLFGFCAIGFVIFASISFYFIKNFTK